jgi:hypothetical protein
MNFVFTHIEINLPANCAHFYRLLCPRECFSAREFAPIWSRFLDDARSGGGSLSTALQRFAGALRRKPLISD